MASIGDLSEDGKFSPEKALKVIPNGIGQITRIVGWSKLDPKGAAELANEVSGTEYRPSFTRSA
ncbi:MAG TPA: hypothetical protein EYP17_12975 [Candidatus Latescibacteria bacterium]|nr:hypothetical protein [Candidatus Latescibacterota bacterium]